MLVRKPAPAAAYQEDEERAERFVRRAAPAQRRGAARPREEAVYNLPLPKDVHRRARVLAMTRGMTLKAYITEAIIAHNEKWGDEEAGNRAEAARIAPGRPLKSKRG